MYTVAPLASVDWAAVWPLTSVNDWFAWKQTQNAVESPGEPGAGLLRTTPSATGKLSVEVIVPCAALNVLLSLRTLGSVKEPVTAIERFTGSRVRVGRQQELTRLAVRRPHRGADRLGGGRVHGPASRSSRHTMVTESATTTLLLVTVVVEPPTSTMLKETGLGSAPLGSSTVFAV